MSYWCTCQSKSSNTYTWGSKKKSSKNNRAKMKNGRPNLKVKIKIKNNSNKQVQNKLRTKRNSWKPTYRKNSNKSKMKTSKIMSLIILMTMANSSNIVMKRMKVLWMRINRKNQRLWICSMRIILTWCFIRKLSRSENSWILHLRIIIKHWNICSRLSRRMENWRRNCLDWLMFWRMK